MSSDSRATFCLLLLSFVLHLGLFVALPLPQVHPSLPKDTGRIQYVVWLLRPAPRRRPAALPFVPAMLQSAEFPAEVSVTGPRESHPLAKPHRQRQATHVPALVQPRELSVREDLLSQPRRPVPWRRAIVVRQQALPSLPDFAAPRLAAAVDPTRPLPRPRQPSPRWREALQKPRQAAEQDDVLRRYLAVVQAALERHKRYPRAALLQGISGRVVLQFVILADGRVVKPRILQSPASTLGEAALMTLRRASPLPPLPVGIAQPRLVVRVPIAYTLVRRR